jgi:hypothetical protein
MVVGPDWKGQTPPGIKKVFTSSTQFSIAIYRTQLFNPADMPERGQDPERATVQPLSAYLKQPAPAAAALSRLKIDKELAKTNFFDYLDFVPWSAPGRGKAIRRRSATIGIGPGETFDFKDLRRDIRRQCCSR